MCLISEKGVSLLILESSILKEKGSYKLMFFILRVRRGSGRCHSVAFLPGGCWLVSFCFICLEGTVFFQRVEVLVFVKKGDVVLNGNSGNHAVDGLAYREAFFA